MTTPHRTFTCEGCGQECQIDADWTEADCAAEQLANFGFTLPAEETARICDSCYAAFLARFGNAARNQ